MSESLRLVRVCELETLLESDFYQQSPHLPISVPRALAQARNPRAQPDDVALALWMENGALVGYLGALPDALFPRAAGAEALRVAWLSCLWIDPNQRGKGIARQLLAAMHEAWAGRLLATEFTGAAEALYDSSGIFADFAKMEGLRGYLRPNLATLLPQKGRFWAKARPLLRGFDWLAGGINAVRLWFWRGAEAGRWRLGQRISEAGYQWVSAHFPRTAEVFRRGRPEWDWMSEAPWLVQAPQPDDWARRYYFSTTDVRFEQYWLEVFDNQAQRIGLVWLLRRGDHLKIMYAFILPAQVAAVAAAVAQWMCAAGCAMVSCFDPALVAHWRKAPAPFFKVRAIWRRYLASPMLVEAAGCGLLHGGDGDAGFT